jgi:hypothetical protein
MRNYTQNRPYNDIRLEALAARKATDRTAARKAMNAAALTKWHATLAAGQHVSGHRTATHHERSAA